MSSLAAGFGASVAALALVLAGVSLPVHGQLPERPVTLVVGSSPGGGVDRTARLFAQKLALELHQTVIVENKDGAGTRLASDYVAKSAPDGRTLLFVTGEAAIDLAFDAAATPNILNDLVPVSLIARCDMLLVVNAGSPYRTLQDLVSRARASPGKLNYSTAGVKTTMHLVGALFNQAAATDVVHIPFKGTVPALTSLMVGDVDFSLASLPSAQPFIDAGKLRALAVANATRSPLLPNVPTFSEAGIRGADAIIWYGLLAPAGTPADVVSALSRAVREASAPADYRQNLTAMGLEAVPGTPAEFGALLRGDVTKYGAIIERAHIRPE